MAYLALLVLYSGRLRHRSIPSRLLSNPLTFICLVIETVPERQAGHLDAEVKVRRPHETTTTTHIAQATLISIPSETSIKYHW